MDLERGSAIVTGGAGGLGSATVRRLAGLGMGVVVFDRDAGLADALAAELGDRVVAVAGDVLDDEAVGDAVTAAQALGPLSVIVNIAGGGVAGGRTVSRDGTPHGREPFETTIEMNVIGDLQLARAWQPRRWEATSPTSTGSGASSSTRDRSPGWRARPASWPTAQRRQRCSA